MVVPAFKLHYGFHLHSHGGPSAPHRQGFRVPNGSESYRPVDIEVDDVLWNLITCAFTMYEAAGR